MATTKKAKTSTTRTLLVYLGDTGLEVSELQFSRQGQKEVSAFRYSLAWLSNPDCFALSPDLPLSTDFQYRTGSGSAMSLISKDWPHKSQFSFLCGQWHATPRHCTRSVGGLSVAIRALELFSHLVRCDAVFVAGVAAA